MVQEHRLVASADTPSIKQSVWQASFDSIVVNGKPVVGSEAAIFDTGTNNILSDSASIATLFGAIDGAQPAPQIGVGVYTSAFSGAIDQSTYSYTFNIAVPCTFNTSFSINVGGKAVSISPASFNLGRVSTGSSTCLAGAAANPNLAGGELVRHFPS
jgi:hypothetical protein